MPLFSPYLKQVTGASFTRATDDVSSPPTDAELDAAFGTPPTVGPGFIGILDDNDGGTVCYICWTTGTDGEWFYEEGTKAIEPVTIVAGNPMGLLLALTYPATP